MNYHRDKKSNPVIDRIFYGAIIALVIVLIYSTSFIPWISKISHNLFDGGLQGQAIVKEGSSETRDILFMSRKKMTEHISGLEQEVFTLRAQVLDYQRLAQENAALRQTLDAGPVGQDIVATSRVLKRPPASLYDTLVIDTGSDDGVAVGHRVVAYGTVYLGTVVQVFEKTATVKLATTQDVLRDVRAVRNGVVLEAQGHNGSHVVIEMPRDVDVLEGDQFVDVLSNKLSLVVYKITFDDREPFKTVYARSPINMRYLDWVQVVR
jgi:rod shape-determining protein MreC